MTKKATPVQYRMMCSDMGYVCNLCLRLPLPRAIARAAAHLARREPPQIQQILNHSNAPFLLQEAVIVETPMDRAMLQIQCARKLLSNRHQQRDSTYIDTCGFTGSCDCDADGSAAAACSAADAASWRAARQALCCALRRLAG